MAALMHIQISKFEETQDYRIDDETNDK